MHIPIGEALHPLIRAIGHIARVLVTQAGDLESGLNIVIPPQFMIGTHLIGMKVPEHHAVTVEIDGLLGYIPAIPNLAPMHDKQAAQFTISTLFNNIPAG